MKIVALINQKGGVGKTATAADLAAFLGLRKRTLLVNLDPQGHCCAEAFALEDSLLSPTIYEEFFGRAQATEAMRALREHSALLPANRELAIGEVELRDDHDDHLSG